MAPIRRYLRITKWSVLECRIYVDNPALAESWLLNPRDPVLPRVIQSVRPLVLPKLREENERRGKGSKKKSVKDIVAEEDFEVSIFLTETSTRHSILTKNKTFREPKKEGLQSNSQKLMGATNDPAIPVEDGPVIPREDSDEGAIDLRDIPDAEEEQEDEEEDSLFLNDDAGPRRSKRPRASTTDTSLDPSPGHEPLPKRRKDKDLASTEEDTDDKKKMAMDVSYEGFSIYGRVLCLVVKRKDRKEKGVEKSGGQAMMEDWITSTQMPQDDDG